MQEKGYGFGDHVGTPAYKNCASDTAWAGQHLPEHSWGPVAAVLPLVEYPVAQAVQSATVELLVHVVK